MGSNGGGTPNNIAASWPHIVDEHALNEASILPHLLHEASEEALQQLQQQAIALERNSGGHEHINEDAANNNEEQQLQNMIENYSKHVIRQKQQGGGGGQQGRTANASAGRSASHLQRKINAPQPTPMSHSHPCLFSDAGNKMGSAEEQQPSKRASIIGAHQPPPAYPNLHSQQHSDPRDVHRKQAATESSNGNILPTQYRHMNGGQQVGTSDHHQQQHNLVANENVQLKQQNERLQRKCDRLEQLELAYRKIERDYEQMLGQQERREELSRGAMQRLEQQLRAVAAENEQLRAQNAKLGAVFGQQQGTDGGEQIHFLLNELIPKNNELLMVQERQRMELEAQSATLEEQRTHIEVLEKALANAQERIAAKERAAVDAVAVVDKCAHLQRMLQEALEDKQRQKEQTRGQVAQLEMEMTQLRLQLAKENNSQSALGSLGRKGGAMAAVGGGGSPEAADEVLKLRRALGQKEERISQLEQSLMKIQGRRFEGGGEERDGVGGGRKVAAAELETKAMRLELEKAEKERRIQELLDEKMRVQMQWAEERRTLDVRVRMLEKDLRHFMGSQSSLASSGGGPFGGAGAIYPPDLSPFASIRGQKSPYLRHRSTAELPTSARGAALYDDRGGGGGVDVMARMEELGRKLAERRAKGGGERTTTVQRPSDLGGIVQMVPPPEEGGQQSRSSSFEQPLAGRHADMLADMSPCSEDHLPNGTSPMLHRQSAPSSAGSSSKKRYLVNAPANQLNAYMEQLPEATRRRLAGDRIGAGGLHLLAGIERNAPGGAGRREGGCRRLIRDHSVDVGRKGAGGEGAVAPSPPQLAPPPNYQEAAAQQRREAPPPPPPPYQQQPSASIQSQQIRQMHQMSSIEEPMQEPPPLPPPLPTPPTYSSANPTGGGGKAVNVVELMGEEPDSDTLNGHKQLVFRRSSLGNANIIAK